MQLKWQICTAADLLQEPPCGRLAQWEWQPDPAKPVVFLCNFHAEPFEPWLRERNQADA